MPLFYSAFGLSLAANRPIPGLIQQPAAANGDVTIWFDALPASHETSEPAADLWYVSETGEHHTPGLRVWSLADRPYFRLRYGDGTEFLVDRAGREIWATWPPSSTLADTATYLLGPVLGFVLRLRGITCLHASAVVIGNRAVALAGPAEAGKSTLAAAFSKMGHRVLADDVSAIVERDGVLYIQPAYPQLRLWPDAVALLYGSADALPRLTPGWDKRALDLIGHGCDFQQEPLPLGAIYLLDGRSAEAQPCLGLHGRDTLRALLANSYVGYLLNAALRAQELEFLGRLASRVPVRRIVPPDNLNLLPQLCRRILDDCEALGCTASPTTAQ